MSERAPRSLIEYRSLAHRAVTEGVNLRYVEQMRQALYQAADEIERLRTALDFYANEGNYKRQPTPDAERGHYPEWTPALDDAGHRAKAALDA